MKTRTILASAVAFFSGIALCYAADPNMGTWKLNEANSKFGPGSARNQTVVYEIAGTGDNVKIIVDGMDKDGKPIHSEWTGKFDGKDYPVTGSPVEDARTYTKVDDRTLEFTSKKGGKAFVTGRVVISADGKSRTVTTTSTDSSGNKIQNTAAYDRQ